MPYRIFWLVAVCIIALYPVSAQHEPRLAVAWVDTGDLWFWRETDSAPSKLVTGTVITPYIAPDGQHIAFTRGTAGQPTGLWTVETGAGKEQEIIVANTTPDEKLLIDQIVWFDATTLYFNTRRANGPFQTRQDDLWRADITTGTAEQLLPDGEGGFFVFSPDHEHIALVRPGAYGEENGRITLVDTNNLQQRAQLSFPAISLASESSYYPLPQWNQESNAVVVSIPPSDLIYTDDGTLETTIWRLALDGSTKQLTTVTSSFFGLPELSSDGQYMTYIRRKGEITANQFELVVTDSANQSITVYASGAAGTISGAKWFPNTNHFFYGLGDIGNFWLGTPDQPPQPLNGRIVYPHFVDDRTYVYATYPGSPYELWYALIGNNDPQLIATFNNPYPSLDALLIP